MIPPTGLPFVGQSRAWCDGSPPVGVFVSPGILSIQLASAAWLTVEATATSWCLVVHDFVCLISFGVMCSRCSDVCLRKSKVKSAKKTVW